MKKTIRIAAMLSACALLLAGCASEPQTQYSINVQTSGQQTDASGVTDASGLTDGETVSDDYNPEAEEDDYVPESAEEVTGDNNVVELPSIVTQAPTPTPIPVISGQYAGATPIVIDPIDKPTATPVPALVFSYSTYTVDSLGLTFEAPMGWTADTTQLNTYILRNPDTRADYATTLTITANGTNVEYTTDMLAAEVTAMLNSVKEAGFSKYSPSNTATRAGLFMGATGVYANYSGTLTDGTEIAGRLAAFYKNAVLYTVHLTYPKAYTETYKEKVYDHLRDTLKLVTAQ